jgi:AraC-like DNA-binding protein
MAFSILPGDDLRVTRHEPSPPLRAHIDGYWSLIVDHPPVEVRVVPDGLVDVVFDLRAREVFVSGPRDDPATFRHDQPARLFGVGLRPGTTLALLGVRASTLSMSWQPLADVVGDAAAPLAQLIADAATERDRLAIADAFFLARIFATSAEPRIARAIAEIVDSDGSAELDAVVRAAGASARNLGRLFDDWVGLSHKRFARVVRLQAAMRRLQEEPSLSLAMLAAELGFADQAHLTREVRVLAGVSPVDLARALSDSFKK